MILNVPKTKNKQFLVKTINNQAVKINDLKVQLQDKLHVINELKHLLAQKTQSELLVVDSRIQKIKDEIVSLAFQVSSLVKEREHIKLEYKKLYDSIKQTRAKTKLQTDSLQQKLNDQIYENNKFSKPPTSGTKLYSVTLLPKSKVIPKVVEKNDLSKSVTSHLTTNKIIEKCTKVLAPGLLKIESEPINAYFKNNRVVHRDYLKVTKEHVATLQELLEEARALKPLDEHIGHASKFAERIQELLVNSAIPEQSSWNFGFLDCRNSIMGYGDLQMGNILISRVYYIEGLGVDLLSSSCDSNLYTISMANMMTSFPICLLSKASKTKSWLWHRRLSYLNFSTINQLAKQGLVKGLPKLKYTKDHLCSSCQMGKSKKESHPHKPEPSINEKLQMLHMDLYGPMRVKFFRMKDEAPEIIIKILKQAQVSLNATVRYLRTDNGTEFLNQTLLNYTEDVGITHNTSTACTPQQNGVVERRNRTLVEAARTMLIFSKSLLFLCGKAVATACYTQNRPLIHTRYNKTPYELLRDCKQELKYLHIFGALCYPTNDFEDLGKLQSKVDIGTFIGYSPSKKVYQVQRS
ncbi:retrovirus-related pol polyprotein from transposon TNT 1-94 [Tanacetum coccineum]